MEQHTATDSLILTWDALEIESPRESRETDWSGAQLVNDPETGPIEAGLPLAA